MDTNNQNQISFIGSGSAGGKGSGLLLIQSILNETFPTGEFNGIKVSIPAMTIIMSDVFGSFIKKNKLSFENLKNLTDNQISLKFSQGSFPETLTGSIRMISNNYRGPLAVRSSSLTEDSLDKPFAGVFATKMIPNNNPDPDIRFRELISAVKVVYSSTWFKNSRDCFNAAGIDINLEKMSVIIQRVHGKNHGRYFYPAFSGVSRSFNFYPFGNCKNEDGIVELAAGLGKTIVDGGKKWFYCPAEPSTPPPASTKNMLDAGQTRFWAVDLNPPSKENHFSEDEFIVDLPYKILETDNVMGCLCSTYSASSDRLEMGLQKTGFRLLDFSPILKGSIIDFNELMIKIIKSCKEKSGCDIEIEFAVNIDFKPGSSAEFAFLQIRPMKTNTEEIEIDSPTAGNENTLVYSTNAIGNIDITDIHNIVYIKPEHFISADTAKMPAELEVINRNIIASGEKYILCGFGRWGSSDPILGIPANWAAVSGSCAIIESTLPDMNPDLSQGSHFFHNILNCGIPYFSLDTTKKSDEGFINYELLSRQKIISQGNYFTHIKTEKSIRIIVDGRKRKGVIKL